MHWITASLGPKGQITLPKRVREALGLREQGELIGFVVEEKSRSVRLKRLEVRSAEADYTEEEIRKLLRLTKERGGRTFASMEDVIRDLKGQ